MPYTALASVQLDIWHALEAAGKNPRAVFERAGLDPDAMRDPDARYPVQALFRLTRLCVEATGNPYWGLDLVDYWHPAPTQGLGYAVLSSDTLLEALQRVARYSRVVNNKEEIILDDTPEGCRIVLRNRMPSLPTADEDYDATMALLVSIARHCYGETLAPARVSMERAPPPDPDRFRAFFRAPIRYRANENSLVLPGEVVRAPLPTANAALARANERIMRQYLERFDRDDLVSQVRARLLERLPSEHHGLADVARSMNTSTRNLQRRLEEAGTSYKKLLDGSRRELAIEYVRDGSYSIKEIAYLLGFSEPANFSRAFRRWTGSSPRAYREGAKTGE